MFKRLLSVVLALGMSASASVPSTFFGMHAHANQMPGAGTFSTYRFWDSGGRWAPMNPSYGKYSFSWMDTTADQVKAEGGTGFIYTFGDVPQWASTQPSLTGCSYNNGGCAMPNINDFRAFVQALAQHSAWRKANGKMGITDYEMWNEPNAGNFWRGSFTQMVQLAQTAYPLIHQYDPSAKVASPAPQGTHGYSWMQNYFAAGGYKYQNTTNFHGYTGGAMPESGIYNVQQLRALMSKYGVSWQPLNDSEHGWWTNSNQAGYLSRHMILAASMGIGYDCWYAWTWGYPLYGGNQTVYYRMRKWLLNSNVSYFSVNGSLYTVPIFTEGLNSKIVWSSGSTVYVSTSGYTQYVDVWGNKHPISSSSVGAGSLPILLTPSGYVAKTPKTLPKTMQQRVRDNVYYYYQIGKKFLHLD